MWRPRLEEGQRGERLGVETFGWSNSPGGMDPFLRHFLLESLLPGLGHRNRHRARGSGGLLPEKRCDFLQKCGPLTYQSRSAQKGLSVLRPGFVGYRRWGDTTGGDGEAQALGERGYFLQKGGTVANQPRTAHEGLSVLQQTSVERGSWGGGAQGCRWGRGHW